MGIEKLGRLEQAAAPARKPAPEVKRREVEQEPPREEAKEVKADDNRGKKVDLEA